MVAHLAPEAYNVMGGDLQALHTGAVVGQGRAVAPAVEVFKLAQADVTEALRAAPLVFAALVGGPCHAVLAGLPAVAQGDFGMGRADLTGLVLEVVMVQIRCCSKHDAMLH